MDFSRYSGCWFALQVRSRTEPSVTRMLELKGYEAFYPASQSAGRHRGAQSAAALFPGYIFCRLDLAVRTPMLTTPRVIRIVGSGCSPEPVPSEEVDSIRLACASGLPLTRQRYLAEGDRVLIQRGPLSGTEGILVRYKDNHRLVVSVTLLQRSIAIEVDEAWLGVTKSAASEEKGGPPHPCYSEQIATHVSRGTVS